jgi:hypothetical protein
MPLSRRAGRANGRGGPPGSPPTGAERRKAWASARVRPRTTPAIMATPRSGKYSTSTGSGTPIQRGIANRASPAKPDSSARGPQTRRDARRRRGKPRADQAARLRAARTTSTTSRPRIASLKRISRGQVGLALPSVRRRTIPSMRSLLPGNSGPLFTLVSRATPYPASGSNASRALNVRVLPAWPIRVRPIPQAMPGPVAFPPQGVIISRSASADTICRPRKRPSSSSMDR